MTGLDRTLRSGSKRLLRYRLRSDRSADLAEDDGGIGEEDPSLRQHEVAEAIVSRQWARWTEIPSGHLG
jgi:hypothetical protein